MPWLSLGRITFALGLCFAAAATWAQDAMPAAGSKQSKAEFWLETGVMKMIKPAPLSEETFTEPRPVVELINNDKVPTWKPNFTYRGQDDKVHKGATLREMAEKAVFRRLIWNLEFSFKPVRMIDVDIPQPNGKFQKKQLYYIVYRVKNNGYHYGYKAEVDAWDHKTYVLEKMNQPIFFFPHFVLDAHAPKVEYVNGQRQESYTDKQYLDRVIPAAMKPIEERERIGATLHDSVSITKVSIPVSDEKTDRSIWGVAIWEDVDPRTDFFAVFVQGLTNAYKFVDEPGRYKSGDAPGTGRTFTMKTLQLNFARAGDAEHRHEGELRYGIPLDPNANRQGDLLNLYGVEAPVDYQWVYR
jgi:hypothetical protein